ncbi:hypothetical protein A1OO_08765 [Enterovibrio norvegicus FF-33]|uniref:hypothetical protein n=1 Tax=Enterovibrio norvegicus TaxID=188144 RepID=UPI0002E749DA|nr:hypothetical protein [Enterovibrio norvegicus]OEE65890.1 hypothetical protein A1OO_08765 [Enterovibrio norvegicus FF-33]
MSIVRAKRAQNFTVISNQVYADGQLSFQAMGMLSYLLSKPDNWTVSVEQLVKVTGGTAKKTGKEGVYNILKELKSAGFVLTRKYADGHITYTVFDAPISDNPNQAKPEKVRANAANPDLAEPDLVAPNTADPDQTKPNQAEPTLISTEYKQELRGNNTAHNVETPLSVDIEPAIFQLPLKGGGSSPVTQSDIETLSKTYSTVDVKSEIAKAADWLISNPTRRKTPRGIKRFITGWLSRSSERLGRPTSMSQQARIEAQNASAVQEWLESQVCNTYDAAG